MTGKVDNLHPEYDTFKDDWSLARACYQGQRAIHELGTQALPMLGGQTHDEYNKYKLRAHFTNYIEPIVEAFNGLVFREKPVVDDIDSLFEENFDNEGTLLEDFAGDVLENFLVTGRVGLLTDYTEATEALTAKDAQILGERAFTKLYTTENITYWRENFFTLRENYTEIADDGFSHATKTQYRVLDLDENGAYRQRIFRQSGNASTFDLFKEIYPTLDGKTLDFIPFTILGRCDKQPLSSLVNLNIAHYQLSADRRHGLHYTALPQPYVTGVELDEDELANVNFKIGSADAWLIPEAQAKAGYLEFTGAGLGEIRVEQESICSSMASAGARLILADEKKGVESAETRAQKNVGQDSKLAGIARMISRIIEKHLIIMNTWHGYTNQSVFQLNTDYTAKSLEPAEVQQLLNLWLQGGITQETLFNSLKDGDFIKTSNTAEEERELAEAEGLNDAPDLEGLNGE